MRTLFYTIKNKDNISDIQQYFNKYSELQRWARKSQEYPNGISDDIISVMFVLNILEKVMDKFEIKLLNEVLKEKSKTKNMKPLLPKRKKKIKKRK